MTKKKQPINIIKTKVSEVNAPAIQRYVPKILALLPVPVLQRHPNPLLPPNLHLLIQPHHLSANLFRQNRALLTPHVETTLHPPPNLPVPRPNQIPLPVEDQPMVEEVPLDVEGGGIDQ
jgi:hypothetical protein